MKNFPPALIFLFFLPMVVSPARSQVIGSSGGGWTIRGTDPIELFFGGKMVTAYQPGYEAGKPYFYPIIGPTGETMTRHWPMKKDVKDEELLSPHHRGLWFGLGRVNGLDFWHFTEDRGLEEQALGIIRHRGMTGVMIKGPAISFTTKSDWVDASDRERRICSDRREFTLFYREDGSFVIDLTLILNADAGDLTIGDAREGAWAIQVPPTLQIKGKAATGHVLSSEGIADTETDGKRAAWVDCFGNDGAGNPAGIAILDHPSNFRHPTWWNVRDDGFFAANPFGQGSFDEAADENAGEHLIPNGESLKFRHRVIFHRGNSETAGIAKAFEAFASK